MQRTSSKFGYPLIISAGLNGSGSTWVFNVIVAIIRRSNSSSRVGTVFSSEFLEDFSASDVDTMVVKTHGLPAAVRTVVRLAEIPVILTVRDPKDGVASLMTRFGMDYEQALENVRESANALAPLGSMPGVFTLRYEDGFTKERGTIDKLANVLGVTLARADRDAIWRDFTPKAVRATIDKLAAEGAFDAGAAASTFDPDTHWHPSHVGKGRVGNWRAVLSAEQAFGVDQGAAAFRAAFGYSPRESDAEESGQILKAVEDAEVARQAPIVSNT